MIDSIELWEAALIVGCFLLLLVIDAETELNEEGDAK